MTADRQNTADTFNIRVVHTDEGPCIPCIDIAASLNGIANAAEDDQQLIGGFAAFAAGVEEAAIRFLPTPPEGNGR